MGFGGAIAGIGAISSLAGGIMGSNAASSAGGAQAAALQNGINFQQSVYNNSSNNLNPYIQGGQGALSQLLGFYGLPGGNIGGTAGAVQNFQNTQMYQFPLQQSQLALNRQLAASGLSNSGAALRDGTQLASGYASAGMGQYLSGLSGIAGAGQSAAGTLAGTGNQAASNIMTGYQGIGNANAAGIVGSNNALMSGIQGSLPYLTAAGISAYNNSGSGGGSTPTTWNQAGAYQDATGY